MPARISAEEYQLLSDQKAADYRAFLQLNPGLLAVTGAIFAAGLAKKSTLAIVLSTLPLLAAAFQLVLNAELQLQLTTYLATFAPVPGGTWERDVAAVRDRYWKRRYPRRPAFLRPSGWNIWIVFGIAMSEVLIGFPWMTGLPDGERAFWISTLVNVLPAIFLLMTSKRIEASRKLWTKVWESYRDELQR